MCRAGHTGKHLNVLTSRGLFMLLLCRPDGAPVLQAQVQQPATTEAAGIA
jgi:hypothetical protein